MTSGLVQFIMLIVVIVLSLILSIVALIKATKEGLTRRWIAIFVLGLGLLFITYLAYNRAEIEPAGWAQILLMLVLVSVTGSYAWSASRQADASVKMAEEMREQRLNEARPYLLIRLAKRSVQWDGIDVDENPLEEFQVTIRNAGKGPAINIKAGLWHPTEYIGYSAKEYLSPDEEWEATISRLPMSAYVENFYDDGKVWLPKLRDIVEQDYPGIIAVEYQDIHKRTWVSYLYLQRIIGEEAYVVGVKPSIVEVDKSD